MAEHTLHVTIDQRALDDTLAPVLARVRTLAREQAVLEKRSRKAVRLLSERLRKRSALLPDSADTRALRAALRILNGTR